MRIAAASFGSHCGSYESSSELTKITPAACAKPPNHPPASARVWGQRAAYWKALRSAAQLSPAWAFRAFLMNSILPRLVVPHCVLAYSCSRDSPQGLQL